MQHSTLWSARGLRSSTAALALLTLASVAACRDDVTDPTPTLPITLPPAQAALSTTASTRVTARIATIQGQTVAEKLAIKVFLGGSSSDTVTVWDNTSKDEDKVSGLFRISVPLSTSYKVCEHGAAPSLVAEGFPDSCKTFTGPTKLIDAGTFVARRRPIVALLLRSTNGDTLRTGATVGWTTSLGTQQTNSDHTGVGQIVSVLPAPSTAVYCETKAPIGYAFIEPRCAAIDVEYDRVYTRTLTHKPLPKAPSL